jgi:heptaprenyl diphosphate synthase
VLDVVGTADQLGKPAGQDLAEGIYTLPVLLALGDPEAGPELRGMLGVPLAQPERDKAREIVASTSAIPATVAAGRRFVDEAVRATEGLGPADALSRGLASLAGSLLEGLPA